MKAKEYLQQLQRLDTVINQKIKEVHDLRLQAQSTGGLDYSKERVQSSPSGDAPFVKPICRIIDLEAEINAEIDSFIDMKHCIFKRYVEFKKFETIAVEMNFTYQYVLNMHGYALKEFESAYKM